MVIQDVRVKGVNDLLFPDRSCGAAWSKSSTLHESSAFAERLKTELKECVQMIGLSRIFHEYDCISINRFGEVLRKNGFECTNQQLRMLLSEDLVLERRGVVRSKELQELLHLKSRRPRSGLFVSKYENPEGPIINKAGQAHTDPKIEALRRQFKLEERKINAGKNLERLAEPKPAWKEAKSKNSDKKARQDQKMRQATWRRKREQKRRWRERTQQAAAGTQSRAAIAPMTERLRTLAVPRMVPIAYQR
jgi:hypothetical protein